MERPALPASCHSNSSSRGREVAVLDDGAQSRSVAFTSLPSSSSSSLTPVRNSGVHIRERQIRKTNTRTSYIMAMSVRAREREGARAGWGGPRRLCSNLLSVTTTPIRAHISSPHHIPVPLILILPPTPTRAGDRIAPRLKLFYLVLDANRAWGQVDEVDKYKHVPEISHRMQHEQTQEYLQLR